MIRAVILMLALVSACTAKKGPDVAADASAVVDAGIDEPQVEVQPRELPLFRSGSRLRAQVWSADERAIAVESWLDQELNMPCSFLKTGDGSVRCSAA